MEGVERVIYIATSRHLASANTGTDGLIGQTDFKGQKAISLNR